MPIDNNSNIPVQFYIGNSSCNEDKLPEQRNGNLIIDKSGAIYVDDNENRTKIAESASGRI